eukprot:sb/3471728/
MNLVLFVVSFGTVLLVGEAQKLTSKKINKKIKKDILNSDSTADAFNKYIEAYTDFEDTLLQASTDPDTYKKKKAKEQKAFIKSLNDCKKHNRAFRKKKSSYEMTLNSFSIMPHGELENNKSTNNIPCDVPVTHGLKPAGNGRRPFPFLPVFVGGRRPPCDQLLHYVFIMRCFPATIGE